MTSLSLIIYPSEILRKKSVPIQNYTQEKYTELIHDMTKVMTENKGIGLAAPQIGRNIRLAIIQTKEGVLALINPEIIKFSIKKETFEEGCLSIPEVFGLVKRPYKIKVSAILENGKTSTFEARGLLARVILHEIDHLNGKLFIDRAKKITQGKEKLEEIKKPLKT